MTDRNPDDIRRARRMFFFYVASLFMHGSLVGIAWYWPYETTLTLWLGRSTLILSAWVMQDLLKRGVGWLLEWLYGGVYVEPARKSRARWLRWRRRREARWEPMVKKKAHGPKKTFRKRRNFSED